MTWKDLIKATLQDLGVYGSGQELRPEDQADALIRLNDWIDALKTNNLKIYQSARTTWALTGAASYAVGAGAAVNVSRPPGQSFIDGLGYVDTNVTPNYEVSLGPPLTDDQYRGIAFKTLTAVYPDGFYYAQDYPNGTLYPYPIPTSAGLLGVMYSGVPIDEVTDVNATIATPPGYRLFLRLGLQIKCASLFRVKLGDTTLLEYKTAEADLERVNETLADMSFGVAGRLFSNGAGSKSNIYTGEA